MCAAHTLRGTLSGMASRTGNDKTAFGGDREPASAARHRSVLTYVLLFVALVLVLDGVAGERGWIANRRESRRLEQVEQQLAAKRFENAQMLDLIRRLRDQDPATIEELARRDLGFIRPGEKVFTIRDVPKPAK